MIKTLIERNSLERYVFLFIYYFNFCFGKYFLYGNTKQMDGLA